MRYCALGCLDRSRIANVEPEALMDRTEAAPFGYRPIPEDVG
jgi:hypothetical protein